MYRQTGSQKTNNCSRYSKKKKGALMENVKLLESLVSRNFVYLYIYSFDCIVVAKPFWFILRINIVHTVILTFLWQISYIPCLYIVYVTRLAIFVAKMSLIIVLVITVYSLLELLVYLMLCDIFYSDISVFGGFVWS